MIRAGSAGETHGARTALHPGQAGESGQSARSHDSLQSPKNVMVEPASLFAWFHTRSQKHAERAPPPFPSSAPVHSSTFGFFSSFPHIISRLLLRRIPSSPCQTNQLFSFLLLARRLPRKDFTWTGPPHVELAAREHIGKTYGNI